MSWAENRAYETCGSRSEHIVALMGTGRTTEEVLDAYPYLEREDILEALSYAAWRAEEIEVSLAS